jgi:GH18 family chitinase
MLTNNESLMLDLVHSIDSLKEEIRSLRTELRPELEDMEAVRKRREYMLTVAKSAEAFTANLNAQKFTKCERQPKRRTR